MGGRVFLHKNEGSWQGWAGPLTPWEISVQAAARKTLGIWEQAEASGSAVLAAAQAGA